VLPFPPLPYLKMKEEPAFKELFYNFNQLMMDKVQDKEISNTTPSSKTFRE
jgi:hypothetical protein